MPRAAKTRVLIEAETPPGSGIWVALPEAISCEERVTVPGAEAWIRKNIDSDAVLRIVKVSGVFRKKETVIKR